MAKCQLRNSRDCDDETTACQHMIYRSVGQPGWDVKAAYIYMEIRHVRGERARCLLHSTTLPVDTDSVQREHVSL